MPTIRELIERLEDHADELGDDHPVLYYNPLTQGYEELELTISSNFIGEDIDGGQIMSAFSSILQMRF